MLKVISIVGARPNFMKVAPIHRAFLRRKDEVEHMIVHTGQHYDVNMSDAFFADLDMPQPKYFLGVGSGSHAVQTAKIMIEIEKILLEEKPDMLIVVGDVNSTIACALTAIKLGIKVAHVEAGLRSFDRDMPEEINRIATDSICDYCFITEKSGQENLKKEGYPDEKVFFVGNTMIDSLVYAKPKADSSNILNELNLKEKEFVLATLHRPSNVDDEEQLKMLFNIIDNLSKQRKVVIPIHPRTKKQLETFKLWDWVQSIDNLFLIEPQGYINFLALMQKADFIMTDSGGIQEETTKLGVPCLTLRTSTERPITCEIGTNKLIQPVKEDIEAAIDEILNDRNKEYQVPELWDGNAADRIADVIIKELSK